MSTDLIVVLDGHAVNPGDLSWESLHALGACTVYDHTEPEEVVRRAAGARVVLTNKTVLGDSEITALQQMQYIGVLATGVNVVDLEAADRNGVVVSNIPAYSTPSVVQMTFALLLELTQQVGYHAGTVRAGRWSQNRDFCYWDLPLIELHGLTFGIVGYGRIGQAVAAVAKALGMQVMAYNRSAKKDDMVAFVDLDTLLQKSDVVSLHCPLTPDTHKLINEPRLAMMKESALLLNTARGALIDEQALAKALNEKRLAGAGLDVLTIEPPPADNPLLTAENCLITPHIAWATKAARQRLMDVAVANVKAFLDGKPQNAVQ